MSTPADEFVFNIVWAGADFPYLRYFVASQIAQSGARFRFVANGCPPEQVTMMEDFASRSDGRVVEVVVASEQMAAHGVALDHVLGSRDDGEFFCFADPDILARGPYVDDFARHLREGCDAVTSGKGVWIDSDVIPDGHPGVSGEFFRSSDGFLFGSPHFAMYHREPLEETTARWGIGFKSAGPDLSDEAKAFLTEQNRMYLIFDTGKLVNVFLQADGHHLCHEEHPNLVHVGGMSHYLAPPERGGGAALDSDPTWAWPWPVGRLEVARFTATVLRALSEGRPAPPVPAGSDDLLAPRLEMVREELIALVETYSDRL